MHDIEIAISLRFISKKKYETYERYIEGCAHNAIARAVKIEDLRDNLNVGRIKHLKEKVRNKLVKKYVKALKQLT